MTIHDLKVWPDHYEGLAADIKRFELRYNDRNYMVGDYLKLREWDPMTSDYTGRRVDRRITSILNHWQAAELTNDAAPLGINWVILSMAYP